MTKVGVRQVEQPERAKPKKKALAVLITCLWGHVYELSIEDVWSGRWMGCRSCEREADDGNGRARHPRGAALSEPSLEGST